MTQWLYDLLWGAPQPAPAVAAPAVAVAPAAAAHVVAAPPVIAVPHPVAPVGPVVPPPLPFPVVNPPISPDAERRQRELAAFLAEIGPREHAVGGHVVARHHPNLTDQQLQARLTTGLDSAGAVAVTGGVSSAFSSEELFQSTLRSVEERLNAGLESTRAYLRPMIEAYKETRRVAEAAQLAALPATLGQAHADVTAHRHAKNDLLAGIGVTQGGNVTNGKFMLPVQSADLPPIANRNQWSQILRSYLVIRLYPSYCITAYHRGQQVGRGFRGTSPRQATVQGQQITVFGVVQPFLGRSDHTFTKLKVLGQHDLRIDRPHDARQWGVTTHFPSDAREESISGA